MFRVRGGRVRVRWYWVSRVKLPRKRVRREGEVVGEIAAKTGCALFAGVVHF